MYTIRKQFWPKFTHKYTSFCMSHYPFHNVHQGTRVKCIPQNYATHVCGNTYLFYWSQRNKIYVQDCLTGNQMACRIKK